MTSRAHPPPGWSESIAEEGYAVAEGVLSEAEVLDLSTALDEVLNREADIATPRGWATDAYRVTYMLPAKATIFLELCRHRRLLALARSVLGDDCRLGALNGFTTATTGEAQRLHVDGGPAGSGGAAYLNIVCALDAFTIDNGATRVVPRSHLPDGGAGTRERERAAVSVELPPGGVVAYTGSTVHGSGRNTTGSPRRSLHVFFRRSWAESHWDFASSLAPAVVRSLDAELRELLAVGGGPRRYDLTTDTVSR